MIDFFSQHLEIWVGLFGTFAVLFLYNLIIVDPLKKRIIFLEEEVLEILNG